MNTVKVAVEKRYEKAGNPTQAGKSVIARYYEDLGYRVHIAKDGESYNHDTFQVYAAENLVWGAAVGFYPIAFISPYTMFASCLKQIGDKELKKYTHLVTVFECNKSVCIYGDIHRGQTKS